MNYKLLLFTPEENKQWREIGETETIQEAMKLCSMIIRAINRLVIFEEEGKEAEMGGKSISEIYPP